MFIEQALDEKSYKKKREWTIHEESQKKLMFIDQAIEEES